jgi:ABC-2 type transport system ATP-binding protein
VERAVIEIIDLYKYYGDRRAVGPLSVSIESGEIVGLLGLNGAGKTTTLRILACDLLPTSGTVRVDDVDVVEDPNRIRAMTGYLPEVPPLYGEMTVDEYLSFAAALRGVAGSELGKCVRDAEGLSGTRKVRHQVIASLSHGYRQRLGIAQAIVHRPRLVVLDEPVAGLDPVQIVEMRKLVRELGGEHTVVVSSHILSEISEMCDRILVIRDGVICAAGTEAELCATLLSGMRVDVSVRLAAAQRHEQAGQVLASVDGVDRVAPTQSSESSRDVASFRVDCTRDVRELLCRALVAADFGVLQLARSDRELESVFLQLSSSPEQRATSPGEGRAARGTDEIQTVEA